MKATGERWERRRWREERPERVAVVGERRRHIVAKDIRRVPQQEKQKQLKYKDYSKDGGN